MIGDVDRVLEEVQLLLMPVLVVLVAHLEHRIELEELLAPHLEQRNLLEPMLTLAQPLPPAEAAEERTTQQQSDGHANQHEDRRCPALVFWRCAWPCGDARNATRLEAALNLKQRIRHDVADRVLDGAGARTYGELLRTRRIGDHEQNAKELYPLVQPSTLPPRPICDARLELPTKPNIVGVHKFESSEDAGATVEDHLKIVGNEGGAARTKDRLRHLEQQRIVLELHEALLACKRRSNERRQRQVVERDREVGWRNHSPSRAEQSVLLDVDK